MNSERDYQLTSFLPKNSFKISTLFCNASNHASNSFRTLSGSSPNFG